MGNKGHEAFVTINDKEEETLAEYCRRTARIARTIWTKMMLPFLSDVIPESIWRVMGGACDPKPIAVLKTLKYALKWRSTSWWQNTKAIEMKNDPYNHTRCKHMWSWNNRGCV